MKGYVIRVICHCEQSQCYYRGKKIWIGHRGAMTSSITERHFWHYKKDAELMASSCVTAELVRLSSRSAQLKVVRVR